MISSPKGSMLHGKGGPGVIRDGEQRIIKASGEVPATVELSWVDIKRRRSYTWSSNGAKLKGGIPMMLSIGPHNKVQVNRFYSKAPQDTWVSGW
jgi:hypothetical protein